MQLMDRFLLLLKGEKLFRLRLIRRFRRDLQAFLQGGQQIAFPPVTNPHVSVIIPVFNSAHHTLRCLQSLVKQSDVALEVIVFDNASDDATEELLQRCKNIVVVKSEKNLGFIKAVNSAAHRARGRFVLLLNNDATLLSGSILDAINIFDTERDVGAVGARIKLASGRVQEAGSIIFRDGTTDGYLRNKKSDHSSGMYMRDVDFCSGVFLLLERQRFVEMGGLDEVFSPAYYEETDLCMRLRAHGLRTVYDPTILIEHFEFGSQPSATAFEAISKRLPIFLGRWQATLDAEGFFPRSGSHMAASRRLVPHPHLLLVLDNARLDEIPNSIRQTMQSAIERKWHVVLFIIGLHHVSWLKFHALYGKKTELVLNSGTADFLKLVRERKNDLDLVAAIGVRSSALVGELQKNSPNDLANVEITSGMSVVELERELEILSN
jgi:GT2 family glycosyltransferase